MMNFADMHKGGRRTSDVIQSRFVLCANGLLLAYLLLESTLPAAVRDTIIVFDVFIITYLTCPTVNLIKWLRTKDSHLPQP